MSPGASLLSSIRRAEASRLVTQTDTESGPWVEAKSGVDGRQATAGRVEESNDTAPRCTNRLPASSSIRIWCPSHRQSRLVPKKPSTSAEEEIASGEVAGNRSFRSRYSGGLPEGNNSTLEWLSGTS